jgi:hypothetical protein
VARLTTNIKNEEQAEAIRWPAQFQIRPISDIPSIKGIKVFISA